MSSVFQPLTTDLPLGPPLVVSISSVSNTTVARALITTITIPGPNVPVPTSFLSATTTRSPPPRDLLSNPACQSVHFAVVPGPAGEPLQYPEIGCSNWHVECCPFGFARSVILTNCPVGFVEHSYEDQRVCCPPDYAVLPVRIGQIRPCYSNLSSLEIYVPATPVSDPRLRLVTDKVFADPLNVRSHDNEPLSMWAIAAIVGAALSVLFLAVGWCFYRRWRRSRYKNQRMTSTLRGNMSQVVPPAIARYKNQRVASTLRRNMSQIVPPAIAEMGAGQSRGCDLPAAPSQQPVEAHDQSYMVILPAPPVSSPPAQRIVAELEAHPPNVHSITSIYSFIPTPQRQSPTTPASIHEYSFLSPVTPEGVRRL